MNINLQGDWILLGITIAVFIYQLIRLQANKKRHQDACEVLKNQDTFDIKSMILQANGYVEIEYHPKALKDPFFEDAVKLDPTN
ncbi:hypothetical protein [Marinoscillum furvescens]|uniref:Uncharacterized protein n=1 Tax=Marinoscillum furvescens DSM 4134 TaxID=1122208 RepID=A0A3D9L4Y6_MARFU|nr:hypothetical protein [Marinoscillum furvescens]REE01083.1 hypothetical protein C7460_104103 [Marinoscillum furvescens DSM 4134]